MSDWNMSDWKRLEILKARRDDTLSCIKDISKLLGWIALVIAGVVTFVGSLEFGAKSYGGWGFAAALLSWVGLGVGAVGARFWWINREIRILEIQLKLEK